MKCTPLGVIKCIINGTKLLNTSGFINNSCKDLLIQLQVSSCVLSGMYQIPTDTVCSTCPAIAIKKWVQNSFSCSKLVAQFNF